MTEPNAINNTVNTLIDRIKSAIACLRGQTVIFNALFTDYGYVIKIPNVMIHVGGNSNNLKIYTGADPDAAKVINDLIRERRESNG